MTDQVENQNQEAQAPAVETPQMSQNEVEARAAGWVPKEEYNGDENKWVDADEFIRRGPLFEKINSQSRELKEMRKTLEQLKMHHHSVKEQALKEARAALLAEKKEALEDGDAHKVVDVDERLSALKEEQKVFEHTRAVEMAQAAAQIAPVHPEFEAWTNRNPWYNQSKPMKAFADALGVELHSSGMSPSEVLKQVEQRVKEEFPNKFRNPNRDRPSAVEGSGKGGGKSHADDVAMTDFERNVMERFVRQGVMTREQYKAELKKTKGIE